MFRSALAWMMTLAAGMGAAAAMEAPRTGLRGASPPAMPIAPPIWRSTGSRPQHTAGTRQRRRRRDLRRLGYR